MKFPKTLVPQKVIAQDLCVSLVTLWRARHSGIAGFPQPVILRNMVFWRRDEIDQLEEALLKFEGRGKFEEHRRRSKRIATLAKAQLRQKRPKRAHRRDDRQRDLFQQSAAIGALYSADGPSITHDADIPGKVEGLVYRPQDILIGGVRPTGRAIIVDSEGYHTGVRIAEMLARHGAEVQFAMAGHGPVSPRLIDSWEERYVVRRAS